MIKQMLISMRPQQWTKNLIIFAGLIFSQNLGHPQMLLRTAAAFFLFCAISGAVYLVNDLVDQEADRRHPGKKNRPLAAGRLSRQVALTGAGVIGAAGVGLSLLINQSFGLTALGYLFLMLFYSLWLKKVVIIDVFTIAAGFVLRAVAGAEAIEVPISDWLLVCVVLLALFLALAKRRQELLAVGEASGRSTLSEYSAVLLDQMIAVVTAAVVVSYSLYTMWPDTIKKFGTAGLKFTIPIVLYGVFRYLYLVYNRQQGQEPERVLLTDRWLLFSLAIYMLAVWLIIYQ